MLISLIVPCYNEEQALPYLYQALCELRTSLKDSGRNFEFIFVNDGSTDRTKEVIKDMVKEDSDVIEKIRNKAKECSLYCSPNLYVETEEGKLYDRSYFIDQAGNVMGHSDMVNIFSAENFYEKDYYAPSEDGYQVYDTPFGRVGIVICFDRHIGESVRSCALQGAQLVLIPTANLKSEF